ncbi:MAG: TolC family protein [Deltaproteobacteria bacterium]|nr:TolC family protein [Deltaproteobacteria bacterium]
MKLVVLSLLGMLGGCVPSRSAVFHPVDREIERRLGLDATWGDERVPAAIDRLLKAPLDRDAAVRIALAKNRRLQVQYDQLGVAASEVAAATVLAPLEVELQYKVALEGDGNELEIEAVQDILDLLQLPQRRGAARADLEAARARAVAATIELVANVERSYVDVVAMQQELELRQTAFEAASASADITERMHAAGNVPDLGLARERDRREQTRIEVARAQLDVEQAREAMNEVLGLSGKDTMWSVTNRLPEIPHAAPALDTIERDAVAASLTLAAIRFEGEAAAGRLGIARVRSVIPELGVGVAASRTDGEWEAGPAVSIGLPLFNQQQGPRARANAELRRSRNEASATATELRAQARATRQRVLAAHAEARHLRDVVMPLRQRIVEETLKHYNAMNASTFELLAARRDLVEGGRQYIDAVRRFWRASAEVRALIRGAMPRGAADVSAPTSSGTSRSEGH